MPTDKELLDQEKAGRTQDAKTYAENTDNIRQMLNDRRVQELAVKDDQIAKLVKELEEAKSIISKQDTLLASSDDKIKEVQQELDSVLTVAGGVTAVATMKKNKLRKELLEVRRKAEEDLSKLGDT